MILLEYFNNKVTKGIYKGYTILIALYDCAKNNPDQGIIIKDKNTDASDFISRMSSEESKVLFISNHNNFNRDFGYIEDTPFIKINKNVRYPTWIKGTRLVYIHANLVNLVSDSFSPHLNFLYWLNSVGKTVRPLGVLCYQEPTAFEHTTLNDSGIYKFVKQHYKRRWTLVLLLCHLIYEKRFPFFAFAKAQFHKSINVDLDIKKLQDLDARAAAVEMEYDVVIPTLLRSESLYQVLLDLSKQQYLPKTVCIAEQNPETGSVSNLGYLYSKDWPFKIFHYFTNTTGACKARNTLIKQTSAEWILLFDDDIRVGVDFSSRFSDFVASTNAKVVTFACLQKNEQELQNTFKQWEAFGSGCSIIHREVAQSCSFDRALEHGYGEDIDYGMQVRNAGYDVIYAPQIQLLHLKAPIGGFRNKFKFPWHGAPVQPKPSPQVMYFRLKCYSSQQLKGYKIVLALKLFRSSKFINPWRFYRKFKKQWESSKYYATQLTD